MAASKLEELASSIADEVIPLEQVYYNNRRYPSAYKVKGMSGRVYLVLMCGDVYEICPGPDRLRCMQYKEGPHAYTAPMLTPDREPLLKVVTCLLALKNDTHMADKIATLK